MVVSCVHPVTVLNAAFCTTCCLLMLAEHARPYGKNTLQSRSQDFLYVSHECLLFTPSAAVSAFIICRDLCACTEML